MVGTGLTILISLNSSRLCAASDRASAPEVKKLSDEERGIKVDQELHNSTLP